MNHNESTPNRTLLEGWGWESYGWDNDHDKDDKDDKDDGDE
ncbi:MAG: hypothetical protein WCE58_07085 [Gallionella sp.]